MSEVGISQEQDLRDLAETDGTDDSDDFCHIVDASLMKTYCGRPHSGETPCDTYRGQAICPSCGLPTCPTCAVRSDLAVRLEGT